MKRYFVFLMVQCFFMNFIYSQTMTVHLKCGKKVDYNAKEVEKITYCNNLPTLGLVAYYPFNGNTNDVSGNNLNGVAHGLTYMNTRNDKAGKFSWLSSVEIADNNLLDFSATHGLTIETRIKLVAAKSGYILVKTGSEGSDHEYSLSVSAEGQLIGSFNKNTSIHESLSSKSRLSINTWYNIILTWRKNGDISLYIDGVLDNTINSPITSIQNTNNPIIIGDTKKNGPHSIIGLINDLRFYNRALNNDEILLLAKSS